MKKQFILFALLSFFALSNAQNDPKFLIGIDMGGGGVQGDFNENWSVRQSVNSYGNYGYSSTNLGVVLPTVSLYYVGLKPEYRFTDRFSVLSGIRFTQLTGSITCRGVSGNYFFLRVNSSEKAKTEYFRVKQINEENSYLGIPLELKYSFIKWKRFEIYGKIGSEIGFLLHKKNDIDFLLPEMEQYEQETLNNIGQKTNTVYSTLSGAIGIGYRTKKDWSINLDFLGGSGFLTESNSTLMYPKVMQGVQFSIMMPLHFSKNK